MMLRLFLLSVLSGVLLQPSLSFAAKYSASDKARIWLCNAARGDYQMEGKGSREVMAHLLYVAAGADPERDSAEIKKQKMQAYWKDPDVLDPKKKGFYCYSAFSQGTLLWQPVSRHAFELLPVMLDLGADINMIDATNGRTILDEVVAFYDFQSMRGETDWSPPWEGHTESYSLRTYREHYKKLRSMGARHARELAQPKQSIKEREASCLKTMPDDEPKEFSDYRGGLSEKFGALTPRSAPGATTVSVRQAACLMNAFGDDLAILHIMRDEFGIPGGRRFVDGARPGEVNDEYQNLVKTYLERHVRDRPILVYCHSFKCFMSYNAALRIAHEGRRHVYWLRDGIQGWKEAGYPIAPVRD